MPYSDNLYSFGDDDSEFVTATSQSTQLGTDNDSYGHARASQGATTTTGEDVDNVDNVDADEDADVFSPTDGYFSTTTDVSSNAYSTATSSNVPHVPNVWVQDPSLHQGSTAESKEREAEQERLANRETTAGSVYGYAADDSFRGMETSRDDSSPTTRSTASASPHPQQSNSIGRASHSREAAYYQPSISASSPFRTPSATTSSSYTRYAPPPVAYHGESSRFLPEEAPPAYTPSPTSPQPSQSTSDSSRNYNTFSPPTGNMGRWEEQGLLAHGPESMRDSYNHVDDEESGRRGRMRRRTSFINWERCRTAVLSLILLLVTVGFLSRLATGIRDERSHRPNPDPSKGKPVMHYPDIDDNFSWESISCSDARYSLETKSFDVSYAADKDLGVYQTVEDSNHHGSYEGHVEGTVVVRRTGSDTPGPSVVVETVVNDERLKVNFAWDAEEQNLVINVPHRHYWEGSPAPCVNIKATIWVPEGSTLSKLEVNTIQLGIKLLDNLSLEVAKNTKLITTVGGVTAASSGSDTRDDKLIDVGAPDSFQFNSRYIEVKTTAAPIRGSWPLYDYLGLKSTAGNIKVCVEPKEADKDKPRPAILYIHSMSGDVDFRQPIHAAQQAHAISKVLVESGAGYLSDLKAEAVLPPRDYRVDVHTTSGYIKGAAAFSSAATFKSTSGGVNVELLPVLDARLSDDTSKRDVLLNTATTSGTTDVTVLEPLWTDSATESYVLPLPAGLLPPSLPDVGISEEDNSMAPSVEVLGGESPLRILKSQHTTTSADVKLKYPASWEGDISLNSLAGRLKVDGQGVKIIKSENDWPGVNKHLLARKGEEGKGGLVTVKTTAGDVEVLVGEK
ncbi:hypothetical protein QBC35DRAFT_475795 [Podospora australis]|uniref:Uncharacterized protein n=1 Tax=Podospora australis TaxID=1536484 RepID=A0AAN6WPQ5_9PEZI|nr:hypothetical protein QBC35DRAFT_475795 [Podospora australis]